MRLVVAVAVALACIPSRASADFGMGFHAAYFLGPGAREPVFRHGGDFFLGAGSFDSRGNRDGLWSSGRGQMVGVSAVLGIGDRPKYVIPEFASAEHTTLAGVGAAMGVVARTDEKGWGLSFRVSGDALLLQVGVRVILIAAPKTDAQLAFTFGFGRF
jgi:hypothetical protein